jgi:hypothetical protein
MWRCGWRRLLSWVESSQWYRGFAEQEARGRSATYERLALAVADDDELLRHSSALPEPKRQPKWAGYLAAAAESGDVTGYRHYWELCVLVGLRDGLRSGDVFVPGSRRYADPASFLLTGERWRLTDDGELIIPPLTAEDVPAEADALRTELAAMLPRIPLASVLVEVDARTGFTDHLVHARREGEPAVRAQAQPDVRDHRRGHQHGPRRHGRVVRGAVPPPADPELRLGRPVVLGRATVPGQGKSITARHLSRYFARGQGVSTYTHDTKVIVATAPESHYVLDGILGNETDLPIAEHATDTRGATLANFALFDLVGKQLTPRIRDLGKITLYRTGPKADFEDRYPRSGRC